jgi:dolichyl-phosphate-mannose--protein O-mannosyl transferase
LRYVQDGWRARWLSACGAAGGMAVATKWSGALAIIAAALIVLVAWILQSRAARRDEAGAPAEAETGTRRRHPVLASCGESVPASPPEGSVALRVLSVLAALVVLPLAVYLLSYVQYFATGHTLADFRELHRQMLTFNLNLEATHTYASAAYTWIVNYRPVWYFFEGKETYYGVVAIGNPFLWWLATLSLVAALVLALLRRSYALLPAAALVIVLYVPWFATSRTSFLYYMTPVAPFMAILLATALCLFAGGVVPRRGWVAVAGVALAVAVLWRPVGIGGAWLFWTLPRRASDTMGWVGVTVGVLLAIAVLILLLSPRLKPYRPWIAMVVAGAVIGTVVAFLPIVLGLPISPEYSSHITWFPSWI